MTTQKGYTLAETLIVLSIFMILSSVTVFSLKPQHSMLEAEVFFSQLKADLYYAQTYAISHQQDVSVLFSPNENKYFIYLPKNQRRILERNYSANISIIKGTLPLTFSFLANGNVNKFGSLFIYTKNKSYQLTFLIGRGRFYILEK